MMNRTDDHFKDVSHRRGGFTLMELLAVVVMIVILMGLLLPAIIKAKDGAAVQRAELQIATLEAAIQQYHSEFKEFSAPVADLEAGVDKTYGAGADGNNLVVSILEIAGTISHVDYRFGHTDGNIMTPPAVGDDCYQITLDLDYDGKVRVPTCNDSGEFRDLSAVSAVWAAGPDGVENTEDDVRSWQ